VVLPFAAVLAAPSCAVDGRQPAEANGQTVRVVNRYPHDRNAYTQGLFFDGGVLYEGTGLVNESSLRRVELTTGNVLQRVDIPGDHFGEGIARAGDRIFQLTWTSGIAYVYDGQSLALLDSMRYQGEGWGLTYDGQALIMSDGTDVLEFRDPSDFSVAKTLQVRDKGAPLRNLNELEYIDGEIWANVYQTDFIARIDPATGDVLQMIDLAGVLTPAEKQGTDVLNGIAWDPQGRRIFVTGKRWPVLLEIDVKR
jgi:glutamine cyclotransferase